MKRFVVLLLSVVGWNVAVFPQGNTSDVKYRLAQSYERAGDFETAVKLYEEIAARDSFNVVVLEALRRDYVQLKRYDDALAVIQRMLRRLPNDVGLLAQLGSTYVLKSDEPKAVEAWERAIVIDPKHEITYRIVGNAIVQSRLFERAIDVYKRGRIALGDPMLFAMDVGYLYSIMMNYADATREYLKMIRQNPAQLSFAQSRIATYTDHADGLSAATTVVEDSAKGDPDNLPVHQLLAWLYMEGKQFDRAYDVHKLIDTKTNAKGNELINFAERALRERAYHSAARAFQEILSAYPQFPRAAEVKFGYARTLEESDTANDTLKLFGTTTPFADRPESESKPLYTGAITAYNRVISEHPNTEIAARSLLQIGMIKQEKFFDLEGARAEFEKIERTYARFPQVVLEGKLRLGDVLLALNDLKKAERQYTAIASIGMMSNELKERATLRLAELDYFQERFQDALTKLKTLTVNPISDATNDALSLQIFISENLKANESALKQFARADLLCRQHKLSEALTIFESIAKNYPGTDIVDETLIAIGDIQTQMNSYQDAVATYQRAINEYPESIFLDRTLMKMGQVYQLGLRDAPKAIETFKLLLEKYPNSIYASEARKRIRELRGDNI